jgi:hypothetical protein
MDVFPLEYLAEPVFAHELFSPDTGKARESQKGEQRRIFRSGKDQEIFEHAWLKNSRFLVTHHWPLDLGTGINNDDQPFTAKLEHLGDDLIEFACGRIAWGRVEESADMHRGNVMAQEIREIASKSVTNPFVISQGGWVKSFCPAPGQVLRAKIRYEKRVSNRLGCLLPVVDDFRQEIQRADMRLQISNPALVALGQLEGQRRILLIFFPTSDLSSELSGCALGLEIVGPSLWMPLETGWGMNDNIAR